MTPLHTLSMALLAKQLLSLPNFSGDQLDGDGESFSEWPERLELVASACHWDDQARLVNTATRLHRSASRFYRSYTTQQRSSYSGLTTALHERFTPVRLQFVQSSRFHECKQLPNETVDNYAQDLCKLFYRAYSTAKEEGSGAEAMGWSVFACQFVGALVDKLKAKLVGCTGSFKELLSKARFEEACRHDLTPYGQIHHQAEQWESNETNNTRTTGQQWVSERTFLKHQDCSFLFYLWK